jgi:hypothetical protein
MTRLTAARAHIAADYTGPMFTTEQTHRLPSASIEDIMDTNTLLIIVVVLLILGSGGFFYRGRLRR